jgi:uncharacterized LabA/DUF88 family protein
VNVVALCDLLFPSMKIIEIRYFTALMKSLDGNPDVNIRQRKYLTEVTSMDCRITVQLGHIRIDTRIFPKAPKQIGVDGKHSTAKVYKFEEKETDVRIAATMTADVAQAFANHYFLISGDTDFKPLIEMTRARFGAEAEQLSMPQISRTLVSQCQLGR